MQKYNYEGKNYEALLIQIKDELNCELDELYIQKEETEAALFKAKKYKLEVIKKSDVNSFIKEYLLNVCKLMNIEANVEIRTIDDKYSIQIVSNNNQALIAKDGKQLRALQLLLRQALSDKLPHDVLVTLDVSNYKEKRLNRIEREIKKIARDVLTSKIDVSLDPMNSYERRFIPNYDNLTTESIGEGLERHIVIKYVEK